MDNNSVRFCISVPYNDKEVIRAKIKELTVGGRFGVFFCLFFAFVFAFIGHFFERGSFGFISLISIVYLGGALCSLLVIVIGIVLVKMIKYENKFYRYVFYEERVEIFKITKNETGEKTKILYNLSYKFVGVVGQDIAKVKEDSTKITIRFIYWAKRYKNMIIPKSVLNDEVKEEFIEFLKQKTGSRYVVKTK